MHFLGISTENVHQVDKLICIGAYQLGAISTWWHADLVKYRLGAYQVGALTRCISSWCNIDLVHADLVQYRLGAISTWCKRLGAHQVVAISTWCNRFGASRVCAKKHIFCMNLEFFSANVLHFLPKFYLINEVQFRKRIIFIINEVGRGR